MNPTTPLASINQEDFLANYWQKKPLLIRQAFPAFESPISPDELAGLSCQPGVLSRLVREAGGDYPWQVQHGPFEEELFDQLGEHNWTILVQEVDRHVPAVADLFDQFAFLPNWRKDDVMISFASKDAGVGAHIDSYDVFLLQGSGRRRWEIGCPIPEAEARYQDGLDIRILADFTPTEVFELEPGDMLYVPPGVPHNGVALEPCLTYSFGFLAPTRSEIVSDFSEWHEARFGVTRYGDPDLLGGRKAGLIGENDINRVLRLLQQVPLDRASLAEWFGAFITRPQRAPAELEEFEGSFEEFQEDLSSGFTWRRHEGVRVAGWTLGTPHLFADGERLEGDYNERQVELLSCHRELTAEQLSEPDDMKLAYELARRGWAYLVPSEESELEEFEDDDE